MKPLHFATVNWLDKRLTGLLQTGWTTQPENPISLSDREPRPDLIAMRGSPEDYMDRFPTASDIAIVMEVALSSLAEDRGTKRLLYAEAGIPY